MGAGHSSLGKNLSWSRCHAMWEWLAGSRDVQSSGLKWRVLNAKGFTEKGKHVGSQGGALGPQGVTTGGGCVHVRWGRRACCPVTTGRYRFSSLGAVPKDNYTRYFIPPAVTGLTPGSVDTGEEGASCEAVMTQ